MGTNGNEREIDLLSASFSPTYQAVLDCRRDERVKAGLATGLIGKNSKTGALKLATAIDSGETTLKNAKLAIQNLLADTEKRENYSLDGLVNNFEIWVNRSPPEVKTIQLNQTKEVSFYSGVCNEVKGYKNTQKPRTENKPSKQKYTANSSAFRDATKKHDAEEIGGGARESNPPRILSTLQRC